MSAYGTEDVRNWCEGLAGAAIEGGSRLDPRTLAGEGDVSIDPSAQTGATILLPGERKRALLRSKHAFHAERTYRFQHPCEFHLFWLE